jgi:hypothetical protein
MRNLFLLFTMICTVELAFAAKEAATESKTKCNLLELNDKSCELKLKTTTLKLSKRDLPLPGENTAWEQVTLKELGGKKILEAAIWNEPSGPEQRQTLQWIVYEVSGTTLNKLIQKEVQDRTIGKVGSQEYLVTPPDHYGIKLVGNKVEWFHGRRTGVLLQ